MPSIPHRIPNSIKNDVIDVVTHVEKFLPTPPRDHVEYLFKIYNDFVNATYKDDEDINCGGCRSLVIGKLRTIVREWKQQDQNS